MLKVSSSFPVLWSFPCRAPELLIMTHCLSVADVLHLLDVHAAGLKQLPRALELFLQGLTAPTFVWSSITAAAYKKYLLISLIHNGKLRGQSSSMKFAHFHAHTVLVFTDTAGCCFCASAYGIIMVGIKWLLYI